MILVKCHQHPWLFLSREEAGLSLESMTPGDALSEAEADVDEDDHKSVSELRSELQKLEAVSSAATVEMSALSEEISRLRNKVLNSSQAFTYDCLT